MAIIKSFSSKTGSRDTVTGRDSSTGTEQVTRSRPNESRSSGSSSTGSSNQSGSSSQSSSSQTNTTPLTKREQNIVDIAERIGYTGSIGERAKEIQLRQGNPVYDSKKNTVQVDNTIYSNVRGVKRDSKGQIVEAQIEQDGRVYSLGVDVLRAGSGIPNAIQEGDTYVAKASIIPLAGPDLTQTTQATGGAMFIQQNSKGEIIRTKEYDNLSAEQRRVVEKQLNDQGFVYDSGLKRYVSGVASANPLTGFYTPNVGVELQNAQASNLGVDIVGGFSRETAFGKGEEVFFTRPRQYNLEITTPQGKEDINPVAEIIYGEAAGRLGSEASKQFANIDPNKIGTFGGRALFEINKFYSGAEEFVSGIEKNHNIFISAPLGFATRTALGTFQLAGALPVLGYSTLAAIERPKTTTEAELAVTGFGFSTSGITAFQQLGQNVGLFDVGVAAAASRVTQPIIQYTLAGAGSAGVPSLFAEFSNYGSGRGFDAPRIVQSTIVGGVLGGIGGYASDAAIPVISKAIAKRIPVEISRLPSQIISDFTGGVSRVTSRGTGEARTILGNFRYGLRSSGEAIATPEGSYISGIVETTVGKRTVSTPFETIGRLVSQTDDRVNVEFFSRSGNRFTEGFGELVRFAPDTSIVYTPRGQTRVTTPGAGSNILMELPQGSFFKELESGYAATLRSRPSSSTRFASNKASALELDLIGGESVIVGDLTRTSQPLGGLLEDVSFSQRFRMINPIEERLPPGRFTNIETDILTARSTPGEGALLARNRVYRPLEEAFGVVETRGTLRESLDPFRTTNILRETSAPSLNIRTTNPTLSITPSEISRSALSRAERVNYPTAAQQASAIEGSNLLSQQLSLQRTLSQFSLSDQLIERGVRESLTSQISRSLPRVRVADNIQIYDEISLTTPRSVQRTGQVNIAIERPSQILRELTMPVVRQDRLQIFETPTQLNRFTPFNTQISLDRNTGGVIQIDPPITRQTRPVPTLEITIPREVTTSAPIVPPVTPPNIPGFGLNFGFGGFNLPSIPSFPGAPGGGDGNQTRGGKEQARANVFDLLSITRGSTRRSSKLSKSSKKSKQSGRVILSAKDLLSLTRRR